MSESVIAIIISVVALCVALFNRFFPKKKEEKEEIKTSSFNTVPLQLQAYERLALFCERIAIPNLISRISHPQATAQEMRALLTEHIKQEFEYNASQQIYVSKVAWEAVRNLRDQSLLIINQVANVTPPDASATELNKKLLEVMMNHEDAALHTIVADALNFEAKKLMK
jgi:hypothetical protein